jgi:hypothetical protein
VFVFTRGKNNHFGSKMVIFAARNASIYKICELHRAIFSSFYNNSQPNFAILLILSHFLLILSLASYGNGFRSSCPDQNFVYSWNHQLEFHVHVVSYRASIPAAGGQSKPTSPQ